MGELFETFGIDTRLLLIQAVNFGITLVVLWWFLYRPIFKIISERQKKIAEGVAAAERAQEAATRTERERSRIVGEARHQADAIVAAAEQQGKTERGDILKSAQGRADAIVSDAKAQGEELKRESLKESEKEIARIAVLAAEKILQKS